MTVKELREQLNELPDDMELYLQIDPEGNGYNKVSGIDGECIAREDGYETEIYGISWDSDEAGMDEEDWKEMLNQPKVGVIYP